MYTIRRREEKGGLVAEVEVDGKIIATIVARDEASLKRAIRGVIRNDKRRKRTCAAPLSWFSGQQAIGNGNYGRGRR